MLRFFVNFFYISNFIYWIYFSGKIPGTGSFVLKAVSLVLFIVTVYIYNFRTDGPSTDNAYIVSYGNVMITIIYLLLASDVRSFVISLPGLFLFVVLVSFAFRNLEYKRFHDIKGLLDSKIQELAELHNISNAINSVLDLEKLLDMVLSVTVDVLKVERVSLFLFDEKKENLVLKISKGLKRELFNNLRIRTGEGIIGRVGQTGEPLLIKDIEKEMPEFAKGDTDKYRNKSFLCVPLKVKNETM
ncbi:MAG: GAF domain-containing protein, partial [Candidatus Muiribacteriaceae bacterium]